MNGFSGNVDNGRNILYMHILVMLWIPDVWAMSCKNVVCYGCENELLGGGLCCPGAFLVVSLILFSTYAYITYQDIKQLGNLKDQTVIVVKAPTDTKLEVTDPDEVHLPAQTLNAGDV